MEGVEALDQAAEIVGSDFDAGSPALEISSSSMSNDVESASDDEQKADDEKDDDGETDDDETDDDEKDNDEADREPRANGFVIRTNTNDEHGSDNSLPGNGLLWAAPATRLEVAVPEMPLEQRNKYDSLYSNTVELIVNTALSSQGKAQYSVQFTDGRVDLLTLRNLVEYKNGKAALRHFNEDTEMSRTGRKRKYIPDYDWDSELDGAVSDAMDLDGGEDDDQIRITRLLPRQMRVLRSRESSNRRSLGRASVDLKGNDGDGSEEFAQPARRLRTRKPEQLRLTSMAFKSRLADQDQDELALEPRPPSDGDGDFLPVISDIALKKRRPNRLVQRSGRLRIQKSRASQQAKLARRGSGDSDIEFEQPRRSSRATRNMLNMQDDSLLDEDSFYVVDDKSPGASKVMSVREVFPLIAPDSDFGSVHMQLCHVCGGSRQRGQILYCQGCSLAFHKNCIGYRSTREHIVTKIGEDSFVLQCRFCIGLYQKKDANAPTHSMCQGCKKPGKACTAFSHKKSTRQEEKLREENGGVDPITSVPSDRVNNADNVLFRCTTCHRGWHQEHLPSTGGEPIGTDLNPERLKDYSVDWQCNECSSMNHRIHRLVAWRPTHQPGPQQTSLPAFGDLNEDGKDYLVKWQDTSYAHCSWMPGAWVYGVASGSTRTAFGKRVIEQDLLKSCEKDAIPNEFLMADIIFNVKMESSTSKARSKQADLANISRVSKIYVKYQGLGYDDVVWDSPPRKDDSDLYGAFVDAYREYIEGRHFRSEPQSKIRERIKTYKNSTFTEVDVQPAGLKRGKLMGYQVEGLNWLLQNYHQGRSVVLADEMGLGKTVQVVSLVTSLIQDTPRCWPFLIVVPNSTCSNWRREFKQWAPDIRVVAYHGGKESQELAYKYELFPNNSTEMKAQVVIMSYDSAEDSRTQTAFRSVHWAGLVVDEGQRLKNDQNILYGALRAMKIPFRLLLTGTPLQNNKRELFNLLQFIDETQDAEKLDMEFDILDKHNLPKLHDKIRPYFLRRTKAGVLKFLPPMAQIILPVTMTVIQEKLSKSIMAKNPQLIQAIFANSKVNKRERGSLNNILMQLRKCLCHPFIYSDAIEERHHDAPALYRNLVEASGKLLLLKIMLPKLKERGHRILIFSQFLQQLDIIEDFLAGMGCEHRRLDGQISSLEKQRRIDAFNEPGSNIFVFLLSTRAGGVGINLATADTVIIMDPDFNPHQDIQALSRAHRIGQKNKVLCFQFMTKDSVEERIMQVGRKKMALDHALIESMDDGDIAGDDLESILKHGAQALFNDDYEKKAIYYDSSSVDKLLDRSQVEQTVTKEEGSAETQFNYARVWANDKLGFEENLDFEEQAPEPINSSVWDQILAQREEEARREAEESREVLGRGARRRMAINYKANASEHNPLPEDIGADSSSDSSDDFAGANSVDDSDEEVHTSTKGKRREISHVQLKTPTATPTKDLENNKINSQPQQSPKAKSSQCAKQKLDSVKPSPSHNRQKSASQPREKGAGPQWQGTKQLPTPTKPPRKAVVAARNKRKKNKQPSPSPPSPQPSPQTTPPMGVTSPSVKKQSNIINNISTSTTTVGST